MFQKPEPRQEISAMQVSTCFKAATRSTSLALGPRTPQPGVALPGMGPAMLMKSVDGPKDTTDIIYIFTVLIQQAKALASGAAIGEGYCQPLMEPPMAPTPDQSRQTKESPPFWLGSWEQRDYL